MAPDTRYTKSPFVDKFTRHKRSSKPAHYEISERFESQIIKNECKVLIIWSYVLLAKKFKGSTTHLSLYLPYSENISLGKSLIAEFQKTKTRT